jgi:hypothetical protein
LLLLGGVDVRSVLLRSVLTCSALLLFGADLLLLIYSATALLGADLLLLLCSAAC